MEVDGRVRHAIEVAEREADGMASAEELAHAPNVAWKVFDNGDNPKAVRRAGWGAVLASRPNPIDGFYMMRWVPSGVLSDGPVGQTQNSTEDAVAAAERTARAELLREIVGNPFHPVAMVPAWQSPLVLSLAAEVRTRFAPQTAPPYNRKDGPFSHFPQLQGRTADGRQ